MVATRAFSASKSGLRERLLNAARRGVSPIEAVPVYAATAWATATAVGYGDIRYSGSRVYGCHKAGTTGATPPTGTAASVSDGAVLWAYLGDRVAIAWATGLTVAAGQHVYNGGFEFRAANSGATAASGSGPTPSTLTDNAVTWIYIGEQTLPLVSPPATTPTEGLPQVIDWNNAKIAYLGGAPDQVGVNPRATINSVTYDGVGTSKGGVAPNIAILFEGLKLSIGGMYFHQMIWVDNAPLALIAGTVGDTTAIPQYITLDWTNVRIPRRERLVRVTTGASSQFYDFRGGPADTFSLYTPADPLRVVLVADSFGEGTSGITDIFGYASQLARGLGIEDFWIAASGGTGVLKTNGGRVSYQDRFTVDVINRAPNVVIIQASQNDGNLVLADVKTALAALVQRVKTELPNAICVVMGVWNTRLQNPLTGNPLTLNDDARAVALAAGVPFIDWSDNITGSGRIDSLANDGNADFNVSWDGTHPTPRGHARHARLLIQRFVSAWMNQVG